MFDLKCPCSNCPFKKGMGEKFRLHQKRLGKIFSATAFQCHKTVDYSEDEPGQGNKPQQCAGVMSILVKEGRPNQIMQVASRLGALDFDEIDPRGEAYGSINEAKAAHCGE